MTCGTYAGWNRHKKLGEQVCNPCLRAAAAYHKALRARVRRCATPGRVPAGTRPSGLGWPL